MLKRKDEVLLFRGWRGQSHSFPPLMETGWRHQYELRQVATKHWFYLFGRPLNNWS